MYLANDVPHAQHVIRHLATYSSKPTAKSLVVLRHLVAYLASHKDVCVSLKWEGQTSGIFHDYPNVDPSENVLEVFTDSDWASDRNTRRSVSCCIICFGRCVALHFSDEPLFYAVHWWEATSFLFFPLLASLPLRGATRVQWVCGYPLCKA